MSAKLPLINLNKPVSSTLASDLKLALRRFGAFRLVVAPETRQHCPDVVIEKAREFFTQPITAKTDIKGYSPFASERVRGRAEIPKESIYFFRHGAEPNHLKGPSCNLYRSVKCLHEGWTPIRLQLLKTISQALDSDTSLTGTTLLDSATIGIHYYDSRSLPDFSAHFSPPHMDSGTLTILFRSHNENDGLEIADLETTEKQDSEGVGSEASFMHVPTFGDDAPEVVVFAGTRLQRLLGRDRVRACVHRVRGPGPEAHNNSGVQRLSIAMFCAPSGPSTSPPS
ncbi:hypothetical protein DTO013E5_2739 [Penicillium roqueforti]|uniref:uncharacterized protein n=1 Tax=Penicillium roqueforti TaxID=5082 RepID=UPI0019090F81|nr:uncharacterized protein LCP9604111_4599 [Penicillium roqueforti]KAF9249443.1 hypothetical protein LCP9604111_4599 [Penicillium roqueforti]KAI1834046.1 hypothetical protein CBS147337_5010 [Penicillium roqueforti]KAI2674836.1 hypothetical protein CBS147355_6650 [Penicillium roqueforti]KAI2687956.1 hypothetical protein LCP963914a_3474 [Penicillium roqueforti]KAI2699895.1 hypothetical protein CBS147372_6205 [Penicillium roqueforti]